MDTFLSWVASLPIMDEMAFHVTIGITLLVDGLLLAFLGWAFHSPRFAKYLIRKPMKMKGVSRTKYLVNTGSSSVVSIGSTLAMIYFFSPWTMTTAEMPWWHIALQGVAALVAYDFGYYWLHRLMHVKKLMPLVHAVHHQARYPNAIDSLYLSPIETIAGLLMLFLAVWVVGPIHYLAFVGVFFVFSTLNIIVHSGMLFPHPFFKPVNLITEKHYKHHYNKHGHNYASVTPLPDRLFGTAI